MFITAADLSFQPNPALQQFREKLQTDSALSREATTSHAADLRKGSLLHQEDKVDVGPEQPPVRQPMDLTGPPPSVPAVMSPSNQPAQVSGPQQERAGSVPRLSFEHGAVGGSALSKSCWAPPDNFALQLAEQIQQMHSMWDQIRNIEAQMTVEDMKTRNDIANMESAEWQSQMQSAQGNTLAAMSAGHGFVAAFIKSVVNPAPPSS